MFALFQFALLKLPQWLAHAFVGNLVRQNVQANLYLIVLQDTLHL